jgi:lysophospholipase L1-like esterase
MRICFIGDSFVNGTGDDECLGWVGRICARARRHGVDITAYNLGIRRDTSAGILTRWRNETVARLPPEYDGRLVFSFGGNDCVIERGGRTRVPFDESVAHATEILSAAKAWLPVLVVGPPPSGDAEQVARIAILSGRIGAIRGERDIPFLSSLETLSRTDVWLREAQEGDGAHPNSGGYAILADLVSEWTAWREWVDR